RSSFPSFPYTTLFRSALRRGCEAGDLRRPEISELCPLPASCWVSPSPRGRVQVDGHPLALSENGPPVETRGPCPDSKKQQAKARSEEHTSELQSRGHL